jgi:hypothetical protein
MMREVAEANGPAVFKRIAAEARGGDVATMKVFMHYLVPRTRVNPEPLETPAPKTTSEAAEQISALAAKIVGGALDLDTAQAAIAALNAFVQARNVSELERQGEEDRVEIARLRAELAEMVARVKTS